MKKPIRIVVIAIFVILSACDSDHSTQNHAIAKAQLKVENVSWLRNKLPAKTLAYFRIPSLWNSFFEGNADSLYPALSHQNNREQVNEIQQAIVDTYLEKIPESYRVHFKLLVKSIKTPLEVAVTNAVDDSMVPNILIGTSLSDFSKADLQALLDSLVTESKQMVRILNPLSDEGKASLIVQMIPVFLDYDFNTGKLALLAGPTASKKVLADLLSQQQADASLKSIMDFENSVDQTGKNHQAWINVKAVYQQNQAMIPSAQKSILEPLGVADIEFVWLGTAQHSGKAEFIVHVQMPDTGLRQLLPRINEGFDVQTAGTPDFAFVVTLPTVEQISQGYELIKVLSPEIQNSDEMIQAGLNNVSEFLGMDLGDLLRAYGQQVIVVKDEAGLWFAQKIKDKNLNQQAFEIITEKFKGKHQTKSLSGVNISETKFSILDVMKQILPLEENMNEMKGMFYGEQKIYTLTENDYVFWSAVPQILADRSQSNDRQSLKAFLKEDLQLNWNQALLAWATESEYVSRDAYHTYLEVLAFLGGVAGTDVDLFKFPTAQDLNLPEKGRFGVALNSSSEFLSLRISYEHSLLESFSGSNGMFVVAVTGVLAAYAIPAYEDYLSRAQVIEKLSSASSIKLYLSESIMNDQIYPTSDEFEKVFEGSDDLLYQPEDGSITISFEGSKRKSLKNKYLSLIPEIRDNGNLIWHCQSNINSRQLPTSCR